MSAKTIEQQRAERRAKAMKANITKVKPVVVKHIMPSQVMSIYDIKTHIAKEHAVKMAESGHHNLPRVGVPPSEGSFAASPAATRMGQGLGQ